MSLRLCSLIAVAAVIATACGGPIPTSRPTAPPPIATATPTTKPSAKPSTKPSALPGTRPSLPHDAPMIAPPYWLLPNGTDRLDEVGGRQTLGQVYLVVQGGAMQGTVLVDGDLVALLTIYTTTGPEPIPGLNAIEQQYGAQIDSATPNPSLPLPSHDASNPDVWTRHTETWRAVTVWIRTTGPPSAMAQAFWWTREPSLWVSLTMQFDNADVEPVLTALLGPAR